jgi:WD40 repeat protein
MATAPFRSMLRHIRKPAGPWKTTTPLLMVVCSMMGYSSESAKPARASEPPKAASNAPRNPVQEEEKVRTDRYGDPLPEGALARLGTMRFRHPFWVSGLAFTPDGKTLASSCWDGSVRLWDSATGKETHCFRDPSKPIPSRGPIAFDGVALSLDGKTLVALGNHETKYVWDVASGKELHRLKGGSGFSLAVSPDGKTVAAGDGEGKIRLWDLKTGKPMRSFKAAARPVRALARPVVALAFSPNSKVLAAGDSAAISATQAEHGVSTVRLWDAATGRQSRELKGHSGGITAVAFAPDGRTLISASHDATLRFWDAATGKNIRKLQVPDETNIKSLDQYKGINSGGVLTVAYSSDSRFLASGSYDGTVRIWDSDTGKELHALRGHGREVTSVVFSPDGKVLASGSFDHTIRLWDAGSGKLLQPRQGADGPVNNLAVSPDGRLAVAVCHDHTIHIWSVATQQQLHILRGHTDFVYAVIFSPDGRVLASGGSDRTVRLWDAATGRELRRLGEHRFAVYSLAFTPEGNTLLSAEGDDTVRFWDVATGKDIRQIPGINSSEILQLSSDGKLLATADRNAVYLLNAKTGKELRRFGGSYPRFALSPDGRMLATQSSYKEKIRLWNVATGEELRDLGNLKPSPGFVGVCSFVFSPDSRLLALVGKENDIELWELLTGKLRRRFHGHQSGIVPLAFSPDGKSLLSGSNDTTVLIWDVARRLEARSGLPSETQLQGLWRDLTDGDAEKADRAIHTLAATAEQSLPFLKRHVQPAKIADEKRLTQLIVDLDSDQFTVRERATQELQRRGEGAETALRQALTKSPTLEARRRMENLLAQLHELPLSSDTLRSLRVVEVLEHIGTQDSLRLLKTLADGASQARLTRETKVALERLGKRRTDK